MDKLFPGFRYSGFGKEKMVSDRDVQLKIDRLESIIDNVAGKKGIAMSADQEPQTDRGETVLVHKNMGTNKDKRPVTIDLEMDIETKKLTWFQLNTQNPDHRDIHFVANFPLDRGSSPVTFNVPGVYDFSKLGPQEKLEKLSLFESELKLI